MADKTYGIKITADVGDLKTGLNEAATAAQQAGKAAASAFQGTARNVDAAALSTKQLQQALRGVPAQFTDIATSLAAGQNPLQVLLQQGGQLKDMFGGIAPAARALGGYLLGLVNPYTVAAAAAGVLALAWEQGRAEAEAFAKALILSGNAAGTSVGQLQALSAGVAEATGATQGRAAEVLAGLVTGGKIAADQLGLVAEAAIAMERATGKAVEDTVREFEALAKNPTQAVLKLNESYRFLTPAIFEQIKALEDQGRTAEATALAQQSLADAQKTAAKEVEKNLGDLERAWKGVKDAAKSGWDAILNIGREDSVETELKKAQKALDEARAGGDSEEIARLQSLIKLRQIAVDARKKEADAEAEVKRQRQLGVDFLANADTAEQKSANARIKAIQDLKDGYQSYIESLRQANPGVDPLGTEKGIAATEKYKARLAELGAEMNKAAIAASDKRLKELGSAFDEGQKKAAALKDEIKALNEQLAKVSSGQGDYAKKAQDLRDKSLTPEQADAKNSQAAQAAIDEAKRLAVYSQNATLDGRAQQAQDYAKRAEELIKSAAEAAGKISDSDLGAKLFDQLDTAQREALQAQKSLKEQQLADVQSNNELIAQSLTELEARVEKLKAGSVVEIKADTASALSQVQAIQSALDAIPAQKTVTVTVQQVGGASGDVAPPDIPARAYGGPLPGVAPHDRADNQLYWGTPGEWVIQRPAVRYYGDDFMRRFNAMEIPRHAFGGQIGGALVGASSRLANLSIPQLPPATAQLMQARDLVMPDGQRFPIQTEREVGEAIERHLVRAALRAGRRR